MPNHSEFLGASYLAALKQHYATLVEGNSINTIDNDLHTGFIRRWSHAHDLLGVDSPDRFQPLRQRAFASERNAWTLAADVRSEGGLRRLAASSSYKGLIHLKPPVDVVLYSNLIWELQPASIIEFGALQGGSGLWLVDQCQTCGLTTEVHSFELLDKCIHPSARHPKLFFHQTDLRNLPSLDTRIFQVLPHPWLVIDDAHTNLSELMPFIGNRLVSGDYYVIEDVLLYPKVNLIIDWIEVCGRLNLLVDSRYTDAFGYNVTCAPNGWLRKF